MTSKHMLSKKSAWYLSGEIRYFIDCLLKCFSSQIILLWEQLVCKMFGVVEYMGNLFAECWGWFTKDVPLTPGRGALRNPHFQLLFECDSIVLSGRRGKGGLEILVLVGRPLWMAPCLLVDVLCSILIKCWYCRISIIFRSIFLSVNRALRVIMFGLWVGCIRKFTVL